jgi:hypothetical protein
VRYLTPPGDHPDTDHGLAVVRLLDISLKADAIWQTTRIFRGELVGCV